MPFVVNMRPSNVNIQAVWYYVLVLFKMVYGRNDALIDYKAMVGVGMRTNK